MGASRGATKAAPRIFTEREKAIAEQYEGQALLFADGFSDAILGVVSRINTTAVCYDYDKCVRILIRRDKLTYEEAMEHMDFNVTGSYVGMATPFFLNRCKGD